MMLSVLFIVLSILLTLIALGFTIGGLVKKMPKVWITSLSAFVVFVMLSCVAIVSSIQRSVDYMQTEEFQQETKRNANALGQSWGNTVTGTAEGLEASLDDEAIAKLANKSAKIVGKGITAVAAGMDETILKTRVFSDESIENEGIKLGRAELIADSLNANFGLYLEFEKNFIGKLRLTAYDCQGLKMDNAEIEIKTEAGKAKVYLFKFDYFEPGLSGYCVLTKTES